MTSSNWPSTSAATSPPAVALVTGASSGVGAAATLRLAAAGTRVAALGRDRARLDDVARQAPQLITAHIADVRDAAAVEAVVAQVEVEVGPIDALINNAAVFDRRPLLEQDEATIRTVVDTGLIGAIWCARAVARRMRARRAGRIVNVASVAGTHGMASQAVYCAAKHGLVGFSAALAQELAPDGVLVSALCPGGIATPLWGGANPYPGDPATLMPVDEVVDAIVFLLSRRPGTLHKSMVFFPTSEWH